MFPAAIQTFIDDAEERGTIDESALEALALEHDLDDEAVVSLREELETRAVDLVAPDLDFDAASSPMSTDSLTLFMNAAGKYRLLTAADDVALPKRILLVSRSPKEIKIHLYLTLIV